MDRSVGGGRTEDAHTVASISNAFEVLRAARPLGQAPPKGGKQAGSKGGSKSAATHSIIDVEAVTCPISDEDLAAFPALSKQESVESRRARGVSYHDARTALHDKYQGFCAEFYNKEFEKLWHEFVAHQSPAAVAEANATATGTPSRAGGSGSGGGGQLQRLGLSAAVLSSRGIGGEADNIDMFGQLDLYLKARHSYTALLQPKDLTAGVNVALRTVLAQLRGPNQQDWGACDVEALHAWYADQTEGPIAKRTTAATAPEAAPSAAADADPDELLTQSLSGDMASRLRPTLFALPPQTQRLTAFFHDVVLGGSGGPAQQLPLALSSRAMATLLDRFAHTDGSIGALATGFDVAAMEHRMGGHLAALAGPAMRAARAEVASAAAGLPDDVVAACAQQFADTSPAARATRAATAEARAAAKAAAASAVGKGGKARGRGESGAPARGGGDGDDDEATGPLSASVGVLVEAVHEAGCAWAAWRLGLLWAHKVAEVRE
ncbi:hypothetical protein FOA52_014764 [Chlamydomonas sp. UWO 241]|nr:hypothetical protein FOA52_014764 [Chlamydomonas sp. UWO 241]